METRATAGSKRGIEGEKGAIIEEDEDVTSLRRGTMEGDVRRPVERLSEPSRTMVPRWPWEGEAGEEGGVRYQRTPWKSEEAAKSTPVISVQEAASWNLTEDEGEEDMRRRRERRERGTRGVPPMDGLQTPQRREARGREPRPELGVSSASTDADKGGRRLEDRQPSTGEGSAEDSKAESGTEGEENATPGPLGEAVKEAPPGWGRRT